ncbi:MAG: hypothetical protein AAGF54_13285, partial [Pseudomonadota bacterium]
PLISVPVQARLGKLNDHQENLVQGTIEIRETTSSETAEVLALYPLAFPDEELRPVVTQLLELGDGVLSLAAFKANALVGYIIFTDCATT